MNQHLRSNQLPEFNPANSHAVPKCEAFSTSCFQYIISEYLLHFRNNTLYVKAFKPIFALIYTAVNGYLDILEFLTESISL